MANNILPEEELRVVHFPYTNYRHASPFASCFQEAYDSYAENLSYVFESISSSTYVFEDEDSAVKFYEMFTGFDVRPFGAFASLHTINELPEVREGDYGRSGFRRREPITDFGIC